MFHASWAEIVQAQTSCPKQRVARQVGDFSQWNKLKQRKNWSGCHPSKILLKSIGNLEILLKSSGCSGANQGWKRPSKRRIEAFRRWKRSKNLCIRLRWMRWYRQDARSRHKFTWIVIILLEPYYFEFLSVLLVSFDKAAHAGRMVMANIWRRSWPQRSPVQTQLLQAGSSAGWTG